MAKVLVQFPGRNESMYNQISATKDQEAADIGRRLVANLKRRTPVDSGNCKGNWAYVTRKDGTVLVYNNTEYLEYLAKGSSKQAPSGWIDDTIRSTREEMRDE